METTDNMKWLDSYDGKKIVVQLHDKFMRILYQTARDCASEAVKVIEREGLRPVESAKPPTSAEETRKLIEKKVRVSEIARIRKKSQSTILSHLEKLIASGSNLDIEYLRPSDQNSQQIFRAFIETGAERLKPIREYLGKNYRYEEIRLVRIFLMHDKVHWKREGPIHVSNSSTGKWTRSQDHQVN